MRLGFAAIAIALAVVAIGMIAGQDLLDITLTTISLAIAMVPEGLPAVVTNTLVLGAGAVLTNEVGKIISDLGKPVTIVSDNSTKFTSMTILQWVQDTGINWHDIVSEKPTKNTFTGSFNDKLRDERLNEHYSVRWPRHGKRWKMAGGLQQSPTTFGVGQADTEGICR